MLKILFNEKSKANDKVQIEIKNGVINGVVIDDENELQGSDTIEILRPYSSYSFSRASGSVKVYREPHYSDFKFLYLNRLGTSVKMDFAKVSQLFADYDVFQVDTGMICDTEKDIVIRIFRGTKENTKIISDMDYEVGAFNSDDLVKGKHVRDTLWDSYSLSCNDLEWKCNKKGEHILGTKENVIPIKGECLEFIIKKYKSNFNDKLERDIDNDEVFVESSAGLVNNRRVRLKNGVGKFKFYPFGHTGDIKIKLGTKWYTVWNEYNLKLV